MTILQCNTVWSSSIRDRQCTLQDRAEISEQQRSTAVKLPYLIFKGRLNLTWKETTNGICYLFRDSTLQDLQKGLELLIQVSHAMPVHSSLPVMKLPDP